jgi:polyisoprenoid-binding protein YceI
VHIDPATGMAQVDARIRVGSVTMHPAHYRKRLLGSHFFDAQRFPYIHFVSDPLSVDALRNHASLEGQLTLHGVTRPLGLQLSENHCRGSGLDGCTLHLHGWLDRTRYGMHAYRALVSKRVRLDLVIQLKTPVPIAPATARSSNNR